MINCGNIQRVSIDSTVIIVFEFIEDNISLKPLLFFDIIFAILVIAKNKVYCITSAMVVYTQLVSKIFESILKILIHVNADINSVITNIIIFNITTEIELINFCLNKNIVKIRTNGSITKKLKNVKIFLVKQPISNNIISNEKNNIICFLLKFISSFEIILETETIK